LPAPSENNGLSVGLAVATATTRILSSYLFGLTAMDPLAIGFAIFMLLSVGRDRLLCAISSSSPNRSIDHAQPRLTNAAA